MANFIGQANFVECTYLGKEKVQIGKKVLNYPITNKELEARLVKNSTFKLLIRPEDIEIGKLIKFTISLLTPLNVFLTMSFLSSFDKKFEISFLHPKY